MGVKQTLTAPANRAQLHAYAQEQDGCCKVQLIYEPRGCRTVVLHPPGDELGGVAEWEYYFTDEPESFDFERFGIS